MKLSRWLSLVGGLLLLLGAWTWLRTQPAPDRIHYDPVFELSQAPVGREIPVTLKVHVAGSKGVPLLGYERC